MTALLDLPEVRERILRLSVEDYHRQTEGQKTELLRGIVLRNMSKSPLHRFVADEIREILVSQITPELTVSHETPMTLADSEPEPDLCIVRGARADFRQVHPSTAELVVEVAVSSLDLDRVKAILYAEAGVKEYWIVCPEERQVEAYRQPTPQGYSERTVVESSEILESTAVPGVRVDLASLLGP